MRIYFEFKLSKHVGFPPPSVLAAADLDDDGNGDAGEWIPLTQDGLKWSGAKDIGNRSADGLTVLAAFVGALGAKYSAVVKKENAEGDNLATSEGVVVEVPSPLWLWCKE